MLPGSDPVGPAAGVHDELRMMVRGRRRDLDANGPTVSLVIPAKNEARNLPWVAARTPTRIHEILLVDGDSEDDTVAVARRLWPRVRVIKQNRRGKGNALACGFAAATGEITVMMDADGSMDPGEIPYFVDALRAGADYAKGSRFFPGGGSCDITPLRAIGNRVLNAVTNFGYGAGYTDLCYGYNAFWTHVVRTLGLDRPARDGLLEQQWGDGFEIETLINIRIHLSGYRVVEVPSYETQRMHGTSNLNAVSDGLRVLRTIFAERRRTAVRPPTAVHEGRAAARPVDTIDRDVVRIRPDLEPLATEVGA